MTVTMTRAVLPMTSLISTGEAPSAADPERAPSQPVGRGDSDRRETDMQSINTAVGRATGDDSAALAALLADSLLAGSLGAWLVPDVAARRRVLHGYAEFVLAHAMEHGHVDTTGDRAAVAVWYRRSEPTPASAPWAYDLDRLFGAHANRFAAFHAYVDAVHPHTPHHYLAHLAVASGHRDEVGSAVLASHLRGLDAEGLPSYAELVSDRPREGLLARLGYRPRVPILLEPGGPAVWRMWREPRGRPGGSAGDELPRRVRIHRIPVRRAVMPAAAPTSH
ncbi:N-acetyltransferase [Micromonospora sp. B11E3]|uniref:N-acetyltransferase n=1 Tax=Micromonospora sp. B11E3 TaxID=3153562 RepID=UPI00325E280D